jgi:hypothetical protein
VTEISTFPQTEIPAVPDPNNPANNLHLRLGTLAALNTEFLDTKTENAAISTFMQAAMQHTQAIGASYLPMDEDGRP